MKDINISFNWAFGGENNYFSSGVSFLLYQKEKKKTSIKLGYFLFFLSKKLTALLIIRSL